MKCISEIYLPLENQGENKNGREGGGGIPGKGNSHGKRL
jgi:hypothetical protein